MKSLLLDNTTWDLCIDASGNIAVGAAPYALAQDAASSIRTFKGEVWYDTARGIPYFEQILGKFPSPAFMKAQFVAAAMLVPGITRARCYITGTKGRTITGQVQITDKTGATSLAGF
jgi:hypothetical protein